MKAFLAALELRGTEDWLPATGSVLEQAGLRTLSTGRRLAGWDAAQIRSLREGLSFTEGFELNRVWVGPRCHALGIRPRRLYFRGSERDPLRLPEHEVIARSSRPSGTGDSAELERLLSILLLIQEGSAGIFGRLLQLDGWVAGAASGVRLGIGSREYPVEDVALNHLYRDVGFDHVPDGFAIHLIPSETVTEVHTRAVAVALEGAAQARGIEPRVVIQSPATVRKRLDELDAGASTRRLPGRAIHLLLPDRDAPPSPSDRALMSALDRHRVPWRRSYADDALQYSVPDQLPSILQAAGGRPHRLCPLEPHGDVWTIGVDLSHRRERDGSNLCVTLLSPKGALSGAWSAWQRRDETASSGILERMIRSAAGCAREVASAPRFLVIRDGRLFENEHDRSYIGWLGSDSTLVECRKNGNPQLFLESGGGRHLPEKATWASTSGGDVIFLVTNPMRHKQALDHVLKVSWRHSWDGLGLGEAGIGKLLIALSFSPGLGLHRRTLPGPIYWADGIAGANDTDLRFRGQVVDADV